MERNIVTRPESMAVTADQIDRVHDLVSHHFEAAKIAIARNCREEFEAANRRAWESAHEPPTAFPDLVLEDIGVAPRVCESMEACHGVVTVRDLLRCSPKAVLAARMVAVPSLVEIYCSLAKAAIERLSKWEKVV